jgi:excisionase family DNA binding protein
VVNVGEADYKEFVPMLTTSDVAHLLNVHINTVRRWSNRGIIKTYRIGSRGDRRFVREDIVSFLKQKLEESG